MINNEIVGDVAVGISLLSAVPLLHRVYTKQTTHSLSYMWLGMGLTAQALWIWYGYNIQSKPILIKGVLSGITTLALLSMKWSFESRGEDKNDEEEDFEFEDTWDDEQ